MFRVQNLASIYNPITLSSAYSRAVDGTMTSRLERVPDSDVFESNVLGSLVKKAEKHADKYDDIPDAEMFESGQSQNDCDDIF
ncbi:MAG: hypothetical protein E7Z87_07440 [Cyanobacteria bacterium SIG26]|nr:hypothetical protein [Cyanobacteria bacterium SIG26]